LPTVDIIAQMIADETWRMNVEGRFWPKAMCVGDWVSCWEWNSGTRDYPSFKIRSHFTVRANRVAFALYNGRSPGELLVCHTCDNPPCVNPLHLFLGTVKDNSDDMVAKGRGKPPDSVGERNGAAKLSAADVVRIRNMIHVGMTNVAIARHFGVGHAMISRIRRGRSWGEGPMQPKYASLRAR
jgi:hypothetical protein